MNETPIITVEKIRAMSATAFPVVTLPCDVFSMNITVLTTFRPIIFRQRFLEQYIVFLVGSFCNWSPPTSCTTIDWPFLRPPTVVEIIQFSWRTQRNDTSYCTSQIFRKRFLDQFIVFLFGFFCDRSKLTLLPIVLWPFYFSHHSSRDIWDKLVSQSK